MKDPVKVQRAIKAGESRYINYIERWKAGLEDGMSGTTNISNHIRRYMFEKSLGRCSECGWCMVNPHSGKVPLEVDHIDGTHTNNREENLRLLCPNCHSLTSTYKALNVGKGRSTRYAPIV